MAIIRLETLRDLRETKAEKLYEESKRNAEEANKCRILRLVVTTPRFFYN